MYWVCQKFLHSRTRPVIIELVMYAKWDSADIKGNVPYSPCVNNKFRKKTLTWVYWTVELKHDNEISFW